MIFKNLKTFDTFDVYRYRYRRLFNRKHRKLQEKITFTARCRWYLFLHKNNKKKRQHKEKFEINPRVSVRKSRRCSKLKMAALIPKSSFRIASKICLINKKQRKQP